MTADNLYRLMDEPSLLTGDTLPLVEQMKEQYPWFQTARVLYLKNRMCVEDVISEDELKKNAVFITDRKKLYNYLHIESTETTESQPVETDENDPFSLIDSFLTAQGTLTTLTSSPLALQPSVSSDYILWAYSNKEEVVKEEMVEESVPLKHQELIDSFLEEEENRESSVRFLPLDEKQETIPSFILEDEEYEKTLDDSYFTETLARIYVKQKRYDKAMQIIQKLNLKYPEKNIYFADQIRFLEKLIINTKK